MAKQGRGTRKENKAGACTSIRIKTTDGLVSCARTLEGETDFGSRSVVIVPKGTEYQGTFSLDED